jgi:hypothetical protein
MSEWIRVNDRLPRLLPNLNYSHDVLTLCISSGITEDFMAPNTVPKGEKYIAIDSLVKWSDRDMPSFRGDRFFGEITHWMPLPEFPND